MAAHARTTRPASAPQVAARQEQEQATVGGLLASIDSLLQHGGLVEAPMAPEAAARQVRGVLAARRQELQVRTDALQRQAQRLEKERRWTDALLGGERTDERFDASAVEARRQRVERDLGDVRRRLEEASLQLGAVDADTRRLAEHPEAARAIGLAHSNGPSLPAAFQGWLEAGSTPSDSEREEALRVACAVPMERLRGELNSTWVDDDTVLSILRGLTAEQRRYIDARFRDEEGDSLKDSILAGLQGTDQDAAEALLDSEESPSASAPSVTGTELDAAQIQARADAVDETTLTAGLRTVEGQYSDARVLSSLQSLDPATRDALLLRKASDLRAMVDGDELARLNALIAGAKDPAGAGVRAERVALADKEARQELHDTLYAQGYTETEIAAQLADPAMGKALSDRAQALDRQRVVKLTALAGDVFAGVDGVGDDPAKIFGALRTLPKGEAAFLEDLYRQRYGMDLRTQLSEDMGSWEGSDGQVALDLLSDEHRTRGLEGVLRYATRGTDDEKLVFDVLEGCSDAEREHLLGQGAESEARWKTLLADLSPREQSKARALLEVDPDQRAVAKTSAEIALHMYGTSWWDPRAMGTDEDPIFDGMQDLSPKQLARLEATWKEQQGTELGPAFRGEFSGDEYKVVMSELAGDKDQADALRLKIAADNWGWGLGTDRRLMIRTYEKAHLRGSTGLEAQLKEQTSLDSKQLLDEEFGSHDAQDPDAERVMMGQYAARGKADDALRLFVAYDGLGTDVSEVKAVAQRYAGADPAQMAKLYEDFDAVAAEMGGSSEGLLSYHQQDIGGREGFDLSHQLQGRATDRADQRRRAQERRAYETEGFGAIGHGATEVAEGMGLHNKASAFERTTGAVIDGTLDGRRLDETQLHAFAQGLSQDQLTYGATRDAVGDTLADGAALTAMAITTALTEGAAAPLWAALWSGVASSGTKLALKDGGVSNEVLLQELAAMGLSVGTAGLGNLAAARGLEASLAKRLVDENPGMDLARAELMAKMLVAGGTQAPSNLANEAMALDPRRMSGGEMAQQLLVGGVRRTVASGLGAGVGHGVDTRNGATTVAEQTFRTGLAKGSGQGAVNAAFDPAIHGAVADGKRDEALRRAGYGVAKDGLTTGAGDAAGGRAARWRQRKPADPQTGTRYVDPDTYIPDVTTPGDIHVGREPLPAVTTPGDVQVGPGPLPPVTTPGDIHIEPRAPLPAVTTPGDVHVGPLPPLPAVTTPGDVQVGPQPLPAVTTPGDVRVGPEPLPAVTTPGDVRVGPEPLPAVTTPGDVRVGPEPLPAVTTPGDVQVGPLPPLPAVTTPGDVRVGPEPLPAVTTPGDVRVGPEPLPAVTTPGDVRVGPGPLPAVTTPGDVHIGPGPLPAVTTPGDVHIWPEPVGSVTSERASPQVVEPTWPTRYRVRRRAHSSSEDGLSCAVAGAAWTIASPCTAPPARRLRPRDHTDGSALRVGAHGPDGPESPLEAADRGLNDVAWHDVVHHLSLGLPFHLAVFEARQRQG